MYKIQRGNVLEYKLINEETIMIYFEQQINPSTFKEVQKLKIILKINNIKQLLK